MAKNWSVADLSPATRKRNAHQLTETPLAQPEGHSEGLGQVQAGKDSLKPKMRHKFNAQPTEVNGRRYDSKKEAKYATELALRQQAGEVLFWLEQVPFHLPGNTKYRVDFMEFHADNTVHFVDVKGMETQVFKLKKRQVEELFPVEIEVV